MKSKALKYLGRFASGAVYLFAALAWGLVAALGWVMVVAAGARMLVGPDWGTGPFGDAIDNVALALNCYWSEKYRRVGYEVKVSRGDFLGELKQPEKTRRSATCCSHFFFAVPSGLVKPTEIPDPYGLITVGPKGGARIAKRSKLPDSQPTWGYLATLLRRLVDEQEAVP
jgi:hypothetical protein